jgi:hypothetical protein
MFHAIVFILILGNGLTVLYKAQIWMQGIKYRASSERQGVHPTRMKHIHQVNKAKPTDVKDLFQNS